MCVSKYVYEVLEGIKRRMVQAYQQYIICDTYTHFIGKNDIGVMLIIALYLVNKWRGSMLII